MLALKSFWGLDRILGNTSRKARRYFCGCNPVKQSNCFSDKVVASAGTIMLVQPSVRVGTTPLVASELRPNVLLRRRMANWFIKFEVIERFLRQLRLRGDVIHVVFKCLIFASSKYPGAYFKVLSFFTMRHCFKYLRFLPSKPDSQSAQKRFRSAGWQSSLPLPPAPLPWKLSGHLAWQTYERHGLHGLCLAAPPDALHCLVAFPSTS